MNITDDDIRAQLRRYASTVTTTPPPIAAFTDSGSPTEQTGSRRGRRRPVIVGVAFATGVLGLGLGVAAATGIFDQHAVEIVAQSLECGITPDDARLVASKVDTMGNTVDYWVLDASAGYGDLIVVRKADGTYGAATMGCDGEPRSAAYPAGRPWATMSSETIDGQYTLVRLHGWIPGPATSAVITLNNGETVTVPAEADGHFLYLATIKPDAGVSPTHIQAIETDGTIVAEGNPIPT